MSLDDVVESLDNLDDAFHLIVKIQQRFGLAGAMFSPEDCMVMSEAGVYRLFERDGGTTELYREIAHDTRWSFINEAATEWISNWLPTIVQTKDGLQVNWG